jgi:predicted MFS family arabinose efflux permease
VEWVAFTEAPYTLYLIGCFLYFWSVYVGWFYIGTFARNELGASQSTGINLLLVLNGVGVIGRMLPAYIAQRWVGGLNLMIPLSVAGGIVLYSWIAVDSISGVWVFAVVYGIIAHGIQSLFPIVLTSLTKDASKVGVRSGMGFTVVVSCAVSLSAGEVTPADRRLQGVAVLTGPPIAGALIERDGGRFLGLQIFSATAMIAAAAVLLSVRWVAVGWQRAKL